MILIYTVVIAYTVGSIYSLKIAVIYWCHSWLDLASLSLSLAAQ